jgi:phosphoribosyl 1,2-cyclic phosphodiesterase
MKIYVIGSGSKGNASLLYDDSFLFLIDCGVSRSKILKALKKIERRMSDIDRIFITHEHWDHISGLKNMNIDKVITLRGTVEGLKDSQYLSPLESNEISGVLVQAIPTSHDATNPCGYVFLKGGEKLVYITDTGYLSQGIFTYIKDADKYVLESNHDIYSLVSSTRSDELKSRILSLHGHLSNEQAGIYLSYLIGSKTKLILLAHISEECNSLDLARGTVTSILSEFSIDLSPIKIVALKQWEDSEFD